MSGALLLLLGLWLGRVEGSEGPVEFRPVSGRRCMRAVPIEIDACRGKFYRYTGLPNLVDQATQKEAAAVFWRFSQLIANPCSKYLPFLMCSVYAPMCDEHTKHLIGPCRPLCEQVRQECKPLSDQLSFKWPRELDCARFPAANTPDQMCMPGPQGEEEFGGDPGRLISRDHLDNQTAWRLSLWINETVERADSPRWTDHLASVNRSLRECGHLKYPFSYVFVNRTNSCSPLCQANILFEAGAKRLAELWTVSFAGISLGSCLLAVLIFFRRKASLRPLERPILFLTGCKLIHALAQVIAFLLGRAEVTCGQDYVSHTQIRLQEGLNNSVCALIFLMQYFFESAAAIWFLCLMLNWALHVNGWLLLPRKRLRQLRRGQGEAGAECDSYVACSPCCGWTCTSFAQLDASLVSAAAAAAEEQCSQRHTRSSYVSSAYALSPRQSKCRRLLEDEAMEHLLARQNVFAWLLPGLGAVFVLISRSVDADELLGVCGVGYQAAGTFGLFVLWPRLALHLGGCALLLLAAAWRCRRGRGLAAADALGLRTGLFCLFLAVPCVIISLCDLYDYLGRARWLSAAGTPVLPRSSLPRLLQSMAPRQEPRPKSEVFLIRAFMSHVIGFTVLAWLVTGGNGAREEDGSCCCWGRRALFPAREKAAKAKKRFADQSVSSVSPYARYKPPGLAANLVELKGAPGCRPPAAPGEDHRSPDNLTTSGSAYYSNANLSTSQVNLPLGLDTTRTQLTTCTASQNVSM